MAETSTPNHPTPIQVTGRLEALAADQDISMFDVNEPVFAEALQITGRQDIAETGGAFVMGASKTFGGDSNKDPRFEGRYIGGRQPEPASPDSLGDRAVIRLQVDHRKPITETDLAQRTAEALLVPARMRNTVRRALGTLSIAAGLLAETVAFAKYVHDNGDFTPGTWPWLAGGAVALVGGGVAIASGHKRARQINTAEQRAAQLTPLTVQRRVIEA